MDIIKNCQSFFIWLLVVFFMLVAYNIFFKPAVFSPNFLGTSVFEENELKDNAPTSDFPPPGPEEKREVVSDLEMAGKFLPPLPRADERVTKKPFGVFITPQNSPVTPEKFYGYHAGVDFEIFPEELNQEVSVKVICEGTLALKKYASGYGGVVVETCESRDSLITVVYGHLQLASISKKVGEKISAGDTLGMLGADKSAETDGERKHLHLGIHKGASINILGYAPNEAALSEWIDPCVYICQK